MYPRSAPVYLGRIVSENGYRVDPESTKALLKLRGYVPKTVGEVRHLAGLLGYYRMYIEKFSRISKPIYDLFKVEQPGSLKGKKKDTWQRQSSIITYTHHLAGDTSKGPRLPD